MLAGVFVQGLVKPADQLLEDDPHRRVVHAVRVQVNVPEPLQHLEEQPRLVELADRVVEIEALDHLAHVLAEPGDIVAQVSREMRRVGEQLFEIVARGVVEREARRPTELRLEILQAPALKLGLPGEYPLLSIGQHTIETAENRQREDDILVMAAPEGVSDEVSNPPDEADDLAMVHRISQALTFLRGSPGLPSRNSF
jgi:hypothetical protein